MRLSREHYIRYSRQLILPEVQAGGQQRIFDARVLLVGLGGLGSPQALYLAASGVGTLGLVDGDRVELSNLHRQVIHSTEDIGVSKVESAAKRIRALNPDAHVVCHPTRLSSANAMEIVQDYEIVVDCTDNFPTRYLLNDACVLLGKPLVYGAIYRFGGQATVFSPARGAPCYRCLFPVPPPPGAIPSCAQAGVLGVVPGLIGMIQASEVLKLILGKGEPLLGRLVLCDVMEMSFHEVALRKDPQCPVCGKAPSIRALIDYEEFCGLRQAAEQAQGRGPIQSINAVELARRLESGHRLTIVDVREEWERELYPGLPGAVQIPYSTIESEWTALVPLRDTQIVVCCLFGYKSLEACRLLQAKGFERVLNLQGGLDEWCLYREQSSAEAGQGQG